MQIPVAVLEKVEEIEKERIKIENMQRKHVLFLALSTLRIDRNTHTIAKSNLENDGEIIGNYYYQLEPAILYMKHLNRRVDYVVMLSTPATQEKHEFTIEGEKKNESAESYFISFIKREVGENIKIISITERLTIKSQ